MAKLTQLKYSLGGVMIESAVLIGLIAAVCVVPVAINGKKIVNNLCKIAAVDSNGEISYYFDWNTLHCRRSLNPLSFKFF